MFNQTVREYRILHFLPFVMFLRFNKDGSFIHFYLPGFHLMPYTVYVSSFLLRSAHILALNVGQCPSHRHESPTLVEVSSYFIYTQRNCGQTPVITHTINITQIIKYRPCSLPS